MLRACSFSGSPHKTIVVWAVSGNPDLWWRDTGEWIREAACGGWTRTKGSVVVKWCVLSQPSHPGYPNVI